MSINGNYEIKKGDNLWNVAKQQLQSQNGKKPTNAEIVRAMKEIAQANGCKSAEECKNKFFNKVGNTINLNGLKTPQQAASNQSVQTTPVQTQQQKITPQQITEINHLIELNFDSEDLTAEIDKNTKAETYEQYIRANKNWKSKNVDNIATGGTHEAFYDKNGNIAAEIAKDVDGNIFLINLNIGNGGKLQMNCENNEIQQCTASSKSYPVSSNKNSTKEVLNEILKKEGNYTVQRRTLVDGTILEAYSKEGHEFATVAKDKNTNEILSIYYSTAQNNISASYYYTPVEGRPDSFQTSMQYHRNV